MKNGIEKSTTLTRSFVITVAPASMSIVPFRSSGILVRLVTAT